MPARGDTPGPLDDYRAKRNFAATPEPAPAPAPVPGADATDGRRFVIQEHHATALHWDLRLEHDGVLWSWALPRGVPRDPARNHLAVRTEDHPLEYIDFAGDIPSGNYGAGSMAVWDRGVYELVKHTEREVVVILHGGRVSGRHALFRTGGRNWMIHRMDPPADPDRVRVPEWIEPMQPKLGRLPVPSIGWSFEVGWGGHRVLTFVEDGRARVARADADAPDRADVTAAFGELRPLGRALGSTDAVLDGELVLLDADGRPDADALAERLLIPGTSRRRRPPVTLMLFDLPWLDGRSLASTPYDERRRRLEALGLHGAAWQVPPVEPDDGAALVAFCRHHHLPVVRARRGDAPYLPGRASNGWIEHRLDAAVTRRRGDRG